MGAGKGKAKRAQSTTPPVTAEAIAGYPKAWSKFVEEGGLASVRLHQYYLGSAPRPLTREHYNKLLNELFSDGVAVGAIVLPDAYNAEDFEFKVNPEGTGNDFRGADISLKSDPSFNATYGRVRGSFAVNRPLSAYQIRAFFTQVGDLVKSIVVEKEEG